MTPDFKSLSILDGGTLALGTVAVTTEVAVLTVPLGFSVKFATANIHNSSGSTVASIAIYKTVRGTKTRICLIEDQAAGDSTPVFELVGSHLEVGAVISILASAASATVYDFTGTVSS